MVQLNILTCGNVAFIASYTLDSVNRSFTLVQQNPLGQITAWIELKAAVNSGKFHRLPAFATVVDVQLKF